MWVSSLPIGAKQLGFIGQYGEINCVAMRLIDGDGFACFLFPTLIEAGLSAL